MCIETLRKMAETFQNKIDIDFTLTVQLDIKDQKSYHIKIKYGEVTIDEGPSENPHLLLVTDIDTLQRISNNEMTALTAAGKARMSDPAPLDWRLPKNAQFTPEIVDNAYYFIQHFFDTTYPEKILLQEKYSRLVHGGHAIPLYYSTGFRSAWYLLKKGEKLNEPGDTNPFPQAFIFINGTGFAEIGDSVIEVEAGESYYIPPYTNHMVWTDNELVLIWLAWGEGA
ncbi:MAG: hypothetical protein HXS44_03805 [Theionarchaea archaeon]|nr:hypothetical protein [Theionarchaea archaeon]